MKGRLPPGQVTSTTSKYTLITPTYFIHILNEPLRHVSVQVYRLKGEQIANFKTQLPLQAAF
jgi:hypothetical protein